MKKVVMLLCLFLFTVSVILTRASPAVGVTPTLIGRGTFDPFKLKSDPQSLVDFQAKSKSPMDVVVRIHDYSAGGSTGWHTHPGPVFITVLEGTVTFYEYDDPTCTPTIVSAGQGYVDTGGGHIGRNETSQPAKDVSVILAPVGLPFRGELAAPGPSCAF
jgi:hypothetical protein